MGLSHPVACKVQEKHGNVHCRVATCSMQGYRLSMEDAHSVHMDLPNHAHTAFLGVFDGHGGASASKFCSETVHVKCAQATSLAEHDIKNIVLQTDEEFLKPENELRTHGSTCVFAIVDFEPEDLNSDENKAAGADPEDPGAAPAAPPKQFAITISNTGDSRCVWGTLKPDAPVKYIQCTEDHKPTNADERNRIIRASGIVSNGRVDGDLSVSRAIGDWQFKTDNSLPLFEQKVSPEPDVTKVIARPGDWLLLACDGIFERLSTEQVARFITDNLKEHDDPVETAKALCDYSLQSGSKDNMTVIIVQFKDGTEWSNKGDSPAGTPFFVDGPLHPEDASFMNAYRRFAVDSGFGDKVPANVPVSDTVQSTPPLLQLIAQLAHDNGGELVNSEAGSTDDSIEE
eukprot:TRINITY_DN532_c0_g1_i1.p1 TRINITY_DN532_c0_g1~~TRINITY_DN532_c0_g1_i1.p1  ORF type:complete len:401 (-),score=72.34 TRINITY_DN532_c0_g1_i1:85-1287(-)